MTDLELIKQLYQNGALPGVLFWAFLSIRALLLELKTMIGKETKAREALGRKVEALERAMKVPKALALLVGLALSLALGACSTASGVGGAAVGTVGGVLCTLGRGVGAATAALCTNANDPVVTSRAAMATTARAVSTRDVLVLEAPPDEPADEPADTPKARILVRKPATRSRGVLASSPDGADTPTEEVCPPCGCGQSPPAK